MILRLSCAMLLLSLVIDQPTVLGKHLPVFKNLGMKPSFARTQFTKVSPIYDLKLCQFLAICPYHEQKTWENAMKERRREYSPSGPCITGILSRCPERKDSDENRANEDLNKKPVTRSPGDTRRDSDPWKNP